MTFLKIKDDKNLGKPAPTVFNVITGGKLVRKNTARNDELSLASKIAAGDQNAMKQVYELHSGPKFTGALYSKFQI